MIEDFQLERIIQDSNENPILEFKREWYWNENDIDKNDPKKWGEFLKDILGLANAYLGYVGEIRYLIIGVSESDRTIHEVDSEKFILLKDLKKLYKIVTGKIEGHATLALPKIEIYWKNFEQKQILVIEIPSPPRLIVLTKDLQTKTKIFAPGTVLIRKGDSVSVASPSDFNDLENEFSEYRKSNNIQSIPNIKKERSIEKIVMSYLSQNETSSLIKDYPIKKKNWDEKIIFEVFKIHDPFAESKYFIYIHEDASQDKTYSYLKRNSIVNDKSSLIVLTEKPEKLKDPNERKKGLRGIFNTEKVYFIDEFGYNFLYKNCISDYEPFGVSVFVESYSDSDLYQNGEKTALGILNEWYGSVSQPILVVKGEGGIGKTTLVKHFLNTIHQSHKDIGLLFIDSNSIINELNRLVTSDRPINDIFDFYEALFNSGKYHSSKKFSQELLQLSIDHGKLIIVLDGIDEVIAKLGKKFEINHFLENIKSQYSTDLEKSKVIITCRDYFWDALNTNHDVSEINLKPFNEELAQEFFDKKFLRNKKKVNKSMELAQMFALSESNDRIYIPYILDMIADSIEEDIEIETSETLKISTILKMSSIKQDYIIGSFCNREIAKLDNFDVDNQVRLFMELSVNYPGKISIYEIESLLKKLNIYQNDERNINQIEKLRGHPILHSNNQEIFFRYDFFQQYFTSIYIGDFFAKRDASKIDEGSLVNLLASYIKYDSGFTRDICRRFEYEEEDLILFCIEAIEKLRQSKNNDEIKKKAISAIFVMILISLQESEKHHFDTQVCTKLLKEIFMNNNEISGFCLIDVMPYQKRKLIFDFSGLKFNNCYFDNYSFFWDCTVDENTYFIDTTFKSLNRPEGIRTTLKRKQFSNGCDIKDIQPIIDEMDTNENDKIQILREELKQFFDLFWERGNFYPRKKERIRGRQKFSKYIQRLLDEKVIEEYPDPRHPKLISYRVCDEYKAIGKIFEQGGSCAEFRRVIKLFQ